MSDLQLPRNSHLLVEVDEPIIVVIAYELDPTLMITIELIWEDGKSKIVQHTVALDDGEEKTGPIEKKVIMEGTREQTKEALQRISKRLAVGYHLPGARRVQAKAVGRHH